MYKRISVFSVFQVFSWGSNSCGQLGHMESPSTVPRLAKVRRPPAVQTKTHRHSVQVHWLLFLSASVIRGDPGLGRERRGETHPPARRRRLHPAHHLLQRTAGEGGRGGGPRPGAEPAGGGGGRGRGAAGRGRLHPAACTAALLHERKDRALTPAHYPAWMIPEPTGRSNTQYLIM